MKVNTPHIPEVISKLVGDEDHNSRSERLLPGNKSVAGLGSQTSLTFPGQDQSLLTSAPTFEISFLRHSVQRAVAVRPLRVA
jgi:hypothetical protein